MAKKIEIVTAERTAKILIDGNEIKDVLSYSLNEDSKTCTLTLSVAIMGEVEVRR